MLFVIIRIANTYSSLANANTFFGMIVVCAPCPPDSLGRPQFSNPGSAFCTVPTTAPPTTLPPIVVTNAPVVTNSPVSTQQTNSPVSTQQTQPSDPVQVEFFIYYITHRHIYIPLTAQI